MQKNRYGGGESEDVARFFRSYIVPVSSEAFALSLYLVVYHNERIVFHTFSVR